MMTKIINVPYKEKGKGIISQLEKEDIIISFSQVFTESPFYQAINVINYNDSTYCFHSKNEKDSYLFIKFSKYRIKVTHYSIQ